MIKALFIAIQVVVVLICITIHELSHGLAAYKLGDDTAKRAGRLTLNPIKHIDPFGAIMLLIVHFGWAKPVPVNPYNFDNMKTGMAWTALAGPASNFILAILASVVYNFFISMFGSSINESYFLAILMYSLQMLIMFNIALGLFNLLPIPPLDGSRIVGAFMSDDMYFRWVEFERKGAYLLMGIIMVCFVFRIPLFGYLIAGPLNFFMNLLIGVTL
jgi:Zn-dependent protease